MSRVAYATIDLAALKHNFSLAKKAAPNAKVMTVIKANAYGHGLLPVANALLDADALAVAHYEEALELRDNGISKRIILLQGFADEVELALLASNRIEPVVHNLQQVELLEKLAVKHPITVWLKVDTGMHRLGVPVRQFTEAWQRLNAIDALSGNISLMTHFANADDPDNPYTQQQITQFLHITQALNVEKSLANSAGLLQWSDSHAAWIRPGIMLYGGSPFKNRTAESLGLQPVMTLKSRLIAVNEILAGESVGYGSTWSAKEKTKLGVIGIGYGDGYPRHVTENTPVMINGKTYPIVGRVSMDMICVDLGAESILKAGDEVILWGEGLSADIIAEHAGTIAYELFCQVTSRVKFEIING